ncbi:MAG: phosphomannomutase/phosphoglucomutase [Patescibacteria group bacterium]
MNIKNINQIFKAYDIRGIYKDEFDEEIAEKTAKATANFLEAKTILVAMDARESSLSLKNSIVKGLIDSGVNVVYIGMTTTPMFYWAVNKENTDGGIMITASHNPSKYNGLKITKKYAAPVGENSGLLDIKNSVMLDNFKSSEKKGDLIEKDLTSLYIEFLSHDIPDLNIKIAMDFSCGASSIIVEKLAKKLNLKITPLCSVGEKESHEGNPLKDENVSDLIKKLKEEKYDLGIAFDTDADRVFFFTSEGEKIDSSVIASLLSNEYLLNNKKSKFIGSVNISKVFKETVLENNGQYIENRVGHVFMKQAMRENDAIFGAELSGHFYFREFFYADSGIFTMIKILNIIKKSGKNISELIKPYKKYFRSGEINFKVTDKEKSLKDIEKIFSDGKISYEDGVTIRFSNFWLNIRGSNTEPLLRVNLEADSEELLKEKLNKIKSILN